MATSSRPSPSSRRWTSWPTASASTGWRSAGATRRSPATSTRRASSSPRARWGSAWRPSRSRSARPFRRPRPAGAAASATLRCSTSPAARGSTARGGHYQPGGRTLVAEAFYDPPTTMLDKDLHGNVSASYAFAAQAVVLDVEEATGAIRVRRVVSAHDVGRALNPLAAEGQIHGGIHMGLGYALAERLVVENGQVLTASFMDYAILRADDMPELVVRLIESHEAEGPFGAKGLGESGVIPVSAAVANAVHDAIGVRFAELPITAARVREALTGPRGR